MEVKNDDEIIFENFAIYPPKKVQITSGFKFTIGYTKKVGLIRSDITNEDLVLLLENVETGDRRI